MPRFPTHPEELAELGLYEIWTGVEELRDHFDPFRFDHRMAAYRQLIDAINRDELFGPDNRLNPLWGLMFQHHWQFRSGRLGTSTNESGRIDPDSAWGYGNYALAVIPWLGAAAAGIVPNLTIAAPPTTSRFQYVSGSEDEPPRVPAEFRRGIDDWRSFFTLVTASHPSDDHEPIRLALWKAHKICLDAVAKSIANIDPAPYSLQELRFLQGWCRMVDYLWAAAWPTDFDFTIKHGSDVLPERLLEDDDDPIAVTDLPSTVQRNVRNVITLARTPAWRHTINLRLWKRVMRTRKARQQVVPLLDAIFNPHPGNAADRRAMLRYLLSP